MLFLDRTHPRARAYIDRARTALAERQRHSDELLHASQALLDQGRTGDARELLREAMRATGDDDRSAALRMRLDRAERIGVPAAAPAAAADSWLDSRWLWWSLVGATALVSVWLVGRLVFSWQPTGQAEPPAVVARSGVPVLNRSDAALVRARTLYARGRLAEALRALDRVAIDSELRPEADQLRVEIQRLLLAADAGQASPSGRLH